MTHTRGSVLLPAGHLSVQLAGSGRGYRKTADQTAACLRRGRNSTVFVTQPCEHMKIPAVRLDFQHTHLSQPAPASMPGVILLTIGVPEFSSPQCQTAPGECGGQSGCDSSKVVEGTVYFSQSASNKRGR